MKTIFFALLERKEEKTSTPQADVSSKANAGSTEDLDENNETKQTRNKDVCLQTASRACGSPDVVASGASTAHVNPSYEEGEDDTTSSKSKGNSTMNSNKDINMNEDKDTDTVALKKMLRQTLPKENIEKASDDMDEADSDSFESSSYEDGDTSGIEDPSSHESTDVESVELFMPETFMDMVPFHSNVILTSRRCSKVSGIGFFPGHHSRSGSKVYQRSPSQARRFSRDENEDYPKECSIRSSWYTHGSPSLPSRHSSRSASKVYQHSPSMGRRRSTRDDNEDLPNESRLNARFSSRYSHGSPPLPNRHSSRSASKVYQKSSLAQEGVKYPVDNDEYFPKGILSSRQNSRINRGSSSASRCHSRVASKKYQTSPLAMEEAVHDDSEYYVEDYSVRPPHGVRFSITPEQFYDTAGVDSIQYQTKNEKPWVKLFKNPVFYKVRYELVITLQRVKLGIIQISSVLVKSE
jgi:hypothetical protein